ncbi:MAG TPA: polysaccharide deacetylase family protein [Gammaproteobacteria bacterium]
MVNNKFFGNNNIIPVVMFHSVGAENNDWVFSYISEPCSAFESKIRHLKKGGFNFITWSDLYEYMQGIRQFELPAILLTFDDGYLDNWVNVYPILKKYGAKGTIFMSTDFVDPSTDCRPNIDDLHAGRCTEQDLDISGFLNWSEMREMEKSGVMDIQSHAATHTWYFTEDAVIDFWGHNSREYPWMPWNVCLEEKTNYMRNDQANLVAPGTPIYKNQKSLVARRFFPAKEIADEITEYVKNNGTDKFFQKTGWESELRGLHQTLSQKYSEHSRYETDAERRARMMDELKGSKDILEKNLGKTIDFICWPGGGYDDTTLDVAVEAGYKSWTLGSQDQSDYRNVPGANPQYIKRIGSAITQKWRGKTLGYTNGLEFYYGVKRHQGSVYHKWGGRVLRAIRIALSRF